MTSRTAPAWHRGRVASWLVTVDHKRIGILYLATAGLFFVAGGIMALLIRTQLAQANEHFIERDTYNQLFTIHGTTMIFLVVVPILAGFANYLVPLMIGARDMAFPRLNALSYWLFLFGGIILLLSFFAEGGAARGGWTSYPPNSVYSQGNGQDLWILSLHVLTIASLAGAINFIVTIHNLRTQGLYSEARAGPDLTGSVFDPQGVERQPPAVHRASQHLNHHGKISVQLPAVGHPAALDPAEQAGDIGDPGCVERGMHLDVEVVAEFQTPEEFENRCVSQHYRGVALLPGEEPWLKSGAETAHRGGIEPGFAVRAAQPTARQQCSQNHPTCLSVLGRVVRNDRTQIRIGDSADLGMVQLGVRSRTVGDRKLVVLGG